MEKTKITVLKRWHEPKVHLRVSASDIRIEMTVEDFIAALSQDFATELVAAVGNPTLMFTQAQLQKKIAEASNVTLKKAAEGVIFAMKGEAIKIV